MSCCLIVIPSRNMFFSKHFFILISEHTINNNTKSLTLFNITSFLPFAYGTLYMHGKQFFYNTKHLSNLPSSLPLCLFPSL